MTTQTADATSREDEALAAIRAAMQGNDWRLEAVLTFTHGAAVQVFARTKHGSGRYYKVGPLLFPAEGDTIADTLSMLGAMAAEVRS